MKNKQYLKRYPEFSIKSSAHKLKYAKNANQDKKKSIHITDKKPGHITVKLKNANDNKKTIFKEEPE